MIPFTQPMFMQAMNHHCFHRMPRYVWIAVAKAYRAMKMAFAGTEGRYW